MTRDQYNEWRNHPATLFFRQFISDRRAALIQGATEAWLNGSDAFKVEGDIERGKIIAHFELQDMPFEVIEAFYKERTDESAATVDQKS